ncbi:MAG TPA: phenylacetic acid degradation protein PaaN [Actinomycetota bacterium]|nr:phenylacetic acid degradation protein PaaN [Actinomycetota bacterium]
MTNAPDEQGPYGDRHRGTLDGALQAIRERGYWSAYPEIPSGKIYGETANDDGRAAFEARLGSRFELDQPGTDGWSGDERSPFGFDLGVTYPHADVDTLLPAMGAAIPAWRDAGPDVRAGVCLEILQRLNRRSFEMAYAVMHTTGQAFVMAFQAGGPHAQDRGLEAVAYAYSEMTRHPGEARWEKPQGKNEPLRMGKRFTVVPRGVSLVIGCNTFPTWNGYPGLFASLVTGNPVLVKPSHRAVLPLAVTVEVAREVLGEAGFDPNLVCLAAEGTGERLASSLAVRPEVRIVDFTGSSGFGNWLEENARQALVYTEKSGVNSIVIHSTDDLKGMVRNIAFSLSLYSGQMCTTPQNILVPREGVRAGDAVLSADEVAAAIAEGVETLLGDPARAVEVLGAIANEGILDRLEEAPKLGDVVLESRSMEHPQFADAVVRTPVMVKVPAEAQDVYLDEHFGPISFVIPVDDTAAALDLWRRTTRDHGAITASVYSTDEEVLRRAEEIAWETGVALSENLTGGVFVNQSAAFSDFHATGANPAANACLTDPAFVSGRFRVVQSRRHIEPEPEGATTETATATP